VVLALVGAFTIVFTALAIVFGAWALVSIRRHRQELAGTGFAIFGIILGAGFTGLTLLAVSHEELFDRVREELNAGQLDYSGPLEIVREEENFAITRPSAKWGVARGASEEAPSDDSLLLGNLGKDAYVQVLVEAVTAGQSLERCKEEVIASLRDSKKYGLIQNKQVPVRTSKFTVRDSRQLETVNGLERLEVLIDLRLAGQPMSYIVRIAKRPFSAQLYVLSAWCHQRRFRQVEADLRLVLDSFRLLR
jgi:hypothetical protein